MLSVSASTTVLDARTRYAQAELAEVVLDRAQVGDEASAQLAGWLRKLARKLATAAAARSAP